MEGFIYLLRHPDKPEFIKGGKSARNPFERLKEHNSNGKCALGGFAAVTNKPWEMVAYIPVDNINTAESWLHKKLGKKHNGLELFATSIERAIDILLSCPYRTDGKVYIEQDHSEDYAIRSEVADHNYKLREMRRLFDRVYKQTVNNILIERANQPATLSEINDSWDRQWAEITGQLRKQREADEEARKLAHYQKIAEQKHRERCISRWQAQLPDAAWRVKQAWRVIAWRAMDEAIAFNDALNADLAEKRAIALRRAQEQAEIRARETAKILAKKKQERNGLILGAATLAALAIVLSTTIYHDKKEAEFRASLNVQHVKDYKEAKRKEEYEARQKRREAQQKRKEMSIALKERQREREAKEAERLAKQKTEEWITMCVNSKKRQFDQMNLQFFQFDENVTRMRCKNSLTYNKRG